MPASGAWVKQAQQGRLHIRDPWSVGKNPNLRSDSRLQILRSLIGQEGVEALSATRNSEVCIFATFSV